MPKRWTTLVGLAPLLLLGIVPPSRVTAAAPPSWAHGAAAVARLGVRLNEVAARHGMSAAQLTSNLLQDPSLFVDADDELLYIDAPAPLQARTVTAAAPSSAVVDPASALTLHSRPGSARVIYLDFDGQTIDGTGWNASTGGPCYADPYDSDGNPAFSDPELTAIAGVWARVAEDFSSMDVDVTTADPGVDAINRTSSLDTRYGTRVVVTYSQTLCPSGKTLYDSVCAGGCGGVSYVGMFDQTTNHDFYQPAFVFQNGVGYDQKLIAEAASHETGHTGGLSHDGTSTSSYYWGQGNWAPIMGAAYYKAITQWSKGEYADANQTQDDLAVMQSNGLKPVADDHPERSPAPISPNAARTGIISSRTDVDVFAITLTTTTTVTITATPAATSPDLDIALTLRNPKAKTIATADPPSGSTSEDVATGMDATITATLTPGTYTARIDGAGAGNPLDTGYTDYASIGAYTVTLTTTST